MTKLLIVTDHIGQDGTGRFLTYLANQMTKSPQIEVELMLFHEENSAFNNYLSKDVKIVNLNLRGRIKTSLMIIYKAIVKQKPDICLFGYTQLLLLGFMAPLIRRHGIKVVFRDTIIPTLYHKGESILATFLNKHAYHRFDYIIAQSDDMMNDLINKWGCNPALIVKVNNPVDIQEITKKADGAIPSELLNKKIPTLVAAGRLAPQKGYDIIIKRISELAPDVPFKLLILGNGHLEKDLKKQINNLKVGDYVEMLGFKTNVPQFIKNSDGLLLSSRYEGFPNIVLEALSLGVPVFTNTCPGGINEIIKQGINGVSCNFENADSFKLGLNVFLGSSFNKSLIIEDTEFRYGVDTIMQQYQNLFLEHE